MRVFRLLLLVLLIISPFLFHIWRKNVVNRLNIEINILEGRVRNLKTQVMRLETSFRRLKSPPVIEKRASEILRMRYPEKGEIIRFRNLRKGGGDE